jgi:hypothetical protein
VKIYVHPADNRAASALITWLATWAARIPVEKLMVKNDTIMVKIIFMNNLSLLVS